MEQTKFAIERKVEQLIEGKPIMEDNRIEPAAAPTMIEEARQLKEELTTVRNQIKSEREKLDKVHAQALLSGRSILGEKEKTKEEQARDDAAEILKRYGK